MSLLVEEIRAADREHSLGVRSLAAADRDRIHERVVSRYGGKSGLSWESLRDYASVQDGEGWRWIREFVGSRSCILLFNRSDEAEMFHVPSGAALDQLLANTFGFEFYVTDTEGTYLICFNHHDFLICSGSAQGWLEERIGAAP